MPHVGHACLKVLDRAGVHVRVMDHEACCGMPAISSGDNKSFNGLLSYNLERIFEQEFDVLVTACATCTMTIRDIWPKMNDNPSLNGTIMDLSSRVMDIAEFVLTRTDIGKGQGQFRKKEGSDVTVTWHDPCHLQQKSQTGRLARNLLSSIPGYRFQEMKNADMCCGSGGSFNLEHYDLSRKIGREKAENILDSGAVLVSTACPACMIQIKDMLDLQGSSVQVKHLMEILLDSLASHASD
jgi:glycolate oxidase iron-sulfur subunit